MDSVTGFVGGALGKKLEEVSDGKIKAHVYPAGQLGADRELIQSCISGDVEFVVQNHSAQVNDITGAKVLDMPYLFPNIDIARATLDDPEFRKAYEALYPEVDLKLLMISDMGYRQTSSNRKIETLEDFKGLDIRTMENPIHIALWKALGANPTPMNRGEVFLALQQGLLMAQEDPYVNFLLNNYQEVQDYAIATNHLFHDITVITNNRFYEELPKEYQDWIKEGCIEYRSVQSKDDPRVHLFVEYWKDQAAIDYHCSTEHFTRIVPQFAEMFDEEENVTTYEVVI